MDIGQGEGRAVGGEAGGDDGAEAAGGAGDCDHASVEGGHRLQTSEPVIDGEPGRTT